MNGWIRLHRKIRSHWIYENPDYLRAWIALLIEVNHTPDKILIKSKLLNVARGQSVKSLDTWASIFGPGWTKQKVRTFFRLLENDRMINTQNEHVTTRLTVCNYDTYQDVQHASNTQSNTDVTRVQHASNTRLTPNKNDKKVKNEKKRTKREQHDAAVFACALPEKYSVQFAEAWQEFCDHRADMSAWLTERALKQLLNKLDGLTEPAAIDALNTSVANGWKGIFPDKSAAATPQHVETQEYGLW